MKDTPKNTTKPIAETNRFIVLDKYTPEGEASERYQSEGDLERELIADWIMFDIFSNYLLDSDRYCDLLQP